MGYTREQLESFREAAVPDLVGPGLRLLFVGINPSLWTAATNTHFAHPGNRFFPALAKAGITDRLIAAAEGLTDEDRQHLLERGVGITNLVNRATARADELSADELRSGGADLTEKVSRLRPVVVAIVGVTAYRSAFADPKAMKGRQARRIGEAHLWVLGNPSGLNAHETVATLAESYAEAAVAAGIFLTT